MISLHEIVSWLDGEYPAALAEDWDNVGFLVGDRSASTDRIMTCLTITPSVCAEAVREKVGLIVSHHPFPFHAVRRISSESVDGSMLLTLIGRGIGVYSPHTAHDSAPDGVNRQLASLLELDDVRPLRENGSGRIGIAETPGRPLAEWVAIVEERLGACRYVGEPGRPIRCVAVACGAADDFVVEAAQKGAELLLLGEARFHACLHADSLGLALILPGHFASERFAVETLAEKIGRRFPSLSCFPSRTERDIFSEIR